MTYLVVLCLFVLLLVIVIYNFESKKPYFKCNHDMDTIKAHETGYSTKYLSTCKKCGKQIKNIFTSSTD